MPNYDPTSIPILKDVIETDESEDTKLDEQLSEHTAIADDITPGLFESEQIEAGINIDLLEEPVDSTTPPLVSEERRDESSIDGESEPLIGIIDDIADEDSSENIAITKSDADDLLSENRIIITADNKAPEADAEPQAVAQMQHASLESIVDSITKELIPDLEQQLRYLIQQALEDRLPDDVLNQLNDDKNKPN